MIILHHSFVRYDNSLYYEEILHEIVSQMKQTVTVREVFSSLNGIKCNLTVNEHPIIYYWRISFK